MSTFNTELNIEDYCTCFLCCNVLFVVFEYANSKIYTSETIIVIF